MSILSIASNASAWRGYEYYLEKKVSSLKRIGEDEYEGKVHGSEKESYQVVINIAHPKKSICSCPHAEGTRICCKHKVAVFFTAFPDEAASYIKAIEEYEQEEEKREQEIEDKVMKYVYSLSKEELRSTLLEVLYNGEDWVFDRFVRDRIGY